MMIGGVADLLLPHEEVDIKLALQVPAWRVLRPRYLAFILYPYEWCFGQLQAAALATLRIQRAALAECRSRMRVPSTSNGIRAIPS